MSRIRSAVRGKDKYLHLEDHRFLSSYLGKINFQLIFIVHLIKEKVMIATLLLIATLSKAVSYSKCNLKEEHEHYLVVRNATSL